MFYSCESCFNLNNDFKTSMKKKRADFFDLVKNYEVHVIILYALVFAFH
jgi:hypothetical protein